MKKFIIPFIFFIAFPVFAQHELFIKKLSTGAGNHMFVQYLEEVQYSERMRAKNSSTFPSIYTYISEENETIFTISARCSIWQETLATANSLSDSGESMAKKKILLPTANGLFISNPPESTMDFLLKAEFSSEIENGNYMEVQFMDKKFFFLPGKRFSQSVRAFFLNPGIRLPLEKHILTSSYGMRKNPVTGNWKFHEGIDLASPTGTPVYACKSGTVKKTARGNPIYGNYVILEHNGKTESLYAHLSQILVEEGTSVTQSTVIGKVGATGQVTGPHLHFEILQNGKSVDPEKMVRK